MSGGLVIGNQKQEAEARRRLVGSEMCIGDMKGIGGWECGERNLLEKNGVEFHVMGTGFTWETQDKDLDKLAAQTAWEHSKTCLQDPSINVVLLDEITYMITYKYIDLDEVIAALNTRPKGQHVVITGRACHRSIIEMADTVSEVRPIKHAFDNGIKAQQGIDWWV